MRRNPLLSLLAVIALAVGAAACGDDEPATPSAVEEQRTDGAAGGGNGVQPSQDIRAAIETCKASVRERGELSADVKAELEKLCEEAESGDPQDAKEATRKVCERIIEESVPEGPARDQALETCRTATE
jgi:predicted outer membrane protein